MLDAYIYDGLRSPFGRHGGCLSGKRPDDLMADVLTALLAQCDVPKDRIEDVILGNVCQSGEDSRNIARFSALMAGILVTAGAQTVNRLCGSSMSAALDAARAITLGDGELYIVGGVESMTRAPHIIAKSESAWSRQTEIQDSTAGKPFPNPVFTDAFGKDTMPQTADNLAEEFSIDRDACDRYAFASQQKFEAARADVFFEKEITNIELKGRKGEPLNVDTDEHPRKDTTLAKMAQLKPLAPEGVVTAANASGINDGAAALIIGKKDLSRQTSGAAPKARIIAGAVTGVTPRTMGIGPAYAIPKALQRAGLSLADMQVIEINEAFAAQVIACCKALNIAPEDSRLNPNGGAIAVGHPLGASGARLIITAMNQLERVGGRYACLSMCIGFGQGISLIIERLKT